jgi:amino acid transporter
MTLCAEISAAAIVIQYRQNADNINVSVWIVIILLLVLCLNTLAVSYFGEAEFIFASIKIVTILGLLIFAVVIDLGGGPNHVRLGFHFWMEPYKAIIPFPNTPDIPFANFLSFFSTLINAFFSYGGAEVVAVAAGETANPRKNIPNAIRRVFWRIVLFYVFGSLAIGVLIPANDPRLLDAQSKSLPGAAQVCQSLISLSLFSRYSNEPAGWHIFARLSDPRK